MDTTTGSHNGKVYTTKNSVCFFEFDSDYPMARHSGYDYISNTKNIKFVVRAVYTVGNYDYMFSYEFFLDGSIQVQVRASGYIQGQYYEGNEEYGYRIHEALSGSMHDHTLNFKLDLDILGTANTAQLTTFVPANERYIWSPQPRQTMKLQRQFVESEDDSRLIWDRETQFRIVNTDKPNKLGEYRGYRILPSDGTTHFTNNQSSNLANCIHPFTFDVAITKQKDTEPQSTHPSDENDVWNPMVNFDTFFDGDSLMQEDLVVWFNLGMHHLPRECIVYYNY
jgi:primary-amine oxidase